MCTVKTASGHDDAGVEVLKAAARQRLAAGQDELDLGVAGAGAPGAMVAHCHHVVAAVGAALNWILLRSLCRAQQNRS